MAQQRERELEQSHKFPKSNKLKQKLGSIRNQKDGHCRPDITSTNMELIQQNTDGNTKNGMEDMNAMSFNSDKNGQAQTNTATAEAQDLSDSHFKKSTTCSDMPTTALGEDEHHPKY